MTTSTHFRALARPMARIIIALLLTCAGTALAREKALLVWVRFGAPADDALRLSQLQDAARRLTAGSTMYTYEAIALDYFDTVLWNAEQLGVRSSLTYPVSHGIYNTSGDVFINLLRDRSGDREALSTDMLFSGPFSRGGNAFHCGMDGNNTIINAADVGIMIASRNGGSFSTKDFSPSPLSPPGLNAASIEITGHTFSVSEGKHLIITGDDNVITVNPGGFCEVKGHRNTIIQTTNCLSAVWEGSRDNKILNNTAGNIVNVGTNTSGTVFSGGTGGAIGICGTNMSFTASGYQISSIPGASATIVGKNNSIFGHTDAVITVRGSPNTVDCYGRNKVFVEGTADDIGRVTVNNCVQGTTVTMGKYSSVYANGANGSIVMNGGDLYAGNQTITVGSGVRSFRIWSLNNGDGNTIIVGYNSTGSILCTNSSIRVSGLSNITIEHSGNTVNNVGLSDTINVINGTDVTVNGESGSIVVLADQSSGSGTKTTTVRASGNRILFNRRPASVWVTTPFNVYGNNNAVSVPDVAGSGDEVRIMTRGTGNYINGRLAANNTVFSSRPTPSTPQSGSCTRTWLVTIVWYLVDANGGIIREISRETYTYSDPIIFSLAGHRVGTQSLADSKAKFDMTNSGRAVRTAWGEPGAAYLVYCHTGKCKIQSKSDMIGNMPELLALVSPGDDRLDKNDEVWSRLRLWVDGEGTADVNRAKLRSFEELGIVSVNLAYTEGNRVDHGNTIVAEGTFEFADGTIGHYAAVNLPFQPEPLPTR